MVFDISYLEPLNWDYGAVTNIIMHRNMIRSDFPYVVFSIQFRYSVASPYDHLTYINHSLNSLVIKALRQKILINTLGMRFITIKARISENKLCIVFIN